MNSWNIIFSWVEHWNFFIISGGLFHRCYKNSIIVGWQKIQPIFFKNLFFFFAQSCSYNTLGNFAWFFVVCWFFQNHFFLFFFKNTIRVSNSLVPDQAKKCWGDLLQFMLIVTISQQMWHLLLWNTHFLEGGDGDRSQCARAKIINSVLIYIFWTNSCM